MSLDVTDLVRARRRAYPAPLTSAEIAAALLGAVIVAALVGFAMWSVP